jgi:hypothetical protein
MAWCLVNHRDNFTLLYFTLLYFTLRFDSRQRLWVSFTTASGPTLGPTQPPIQWVSGALSLGVKRPGSEADHSHRSSAEAKNAWSYTSTPHYVFMAWCLVKHRDNFTLLYFTLLSFTLLYFTFRLVWEGDCDRSRYLHAICHKVCLKPQINLIQSNKWTGWD